MPRPPASLASDTGPLSSERYRPPIQGLSAEDGADLSGPFRQRPLPLSQNLAAYASRRVRTARAVRTVGGGLPDSAQMRTVVAAAP